MGRRAVSFPTTWRERIETGKRRSNRMRNPVPGGSMDEIWAMAIRVGWWKTVLVARWRRGPVPGRGQKLLGSMDR